MVLLTVEASNSLHTARCMRRRRPSPPSSCQSLFPSRKSRVGSTTRGMRLARDMVMRDQEARKLELTQAEKRRAKDSARREKEKQQLREKQLHHHVGSKSKVTPEFGVDCHQDLKKLCKAVSESQAEQIFAIMEEANRKHQLELPVQNPLLEPVLEWKDTERRTCKLGLGHQNARYFYDLGNECRLRGDLELAITHFRKSLTLDNKDVRTWSNLAFLYHLIGQPKEAAKAFQSAIKIDSTISFLHHNLAICFINLKKYQHAVQCMNQALKLDPERSEFYKVRAFAHRNRRFTSLDGDFVSATSDYLRARDLTMIAHKC